MDQVTTPILVNTIVELDLLI